MSRTFINCSDVVFPVVTWQLEYPCSSEMAAGKRQKDVKTKQRHTEVLLMLWTPSAFVHLLASAGAGKSTSFKDELSAFGPVRLRLCGSLRSCPSCSVPGCS